MKKYLPIFILCLMFGPNVFSQDSLRINENWTELKQKLKYRTEITLELTKQLLDSKKIDKLELKNAELHAKELNLICENSVLTQTNINLIKEKNSELTISLTHTLVNLEFDTKLKNKEKTQFIIDQLLVIEQQICIVSNKYNKSCKEDKKEELIFDLNCENKSPKVDFK
ncbi:hypothetical protein [Flavobacterium sp. XS2P14]|uniref:hypothetical protein n=1 Tax=unclassified Flavobacterium TaxID=196869 RepID=UPI003AAD49E1